MAPAVHTQLHLPLEPELSSTIPDTPVLEANALVNRYQCRGGGTCGWTQKRIHLALWQGTARYPNREPESVSVQGLQGKGNAGWGWGV